jgi:transcriptional regulator with XRE-family HTH domain
VDDIPSFGAWLRRRRKALDLTQEALAQLVGCSVVSIRKFEGDEQRPSRPMAERLAAQLQIPIDQQPAFIQYARLGLDAAPPDLPLPTAAQLPARAELVVDQLAAAATRLIPGVAPAPPSTLPSGTVTFLFTDLAGSTRLWEQHPQAMQPALARHDAILHAS